ncbi:DUF5801 repeats-in-toxin domain-containing protein, partial [Mesorhizobium sp. WSM4304]|uniref:DUF5801 repeats-in-toxin domain-containing protein n=1 Tax=Mesorhizobium sp. WSM4304 TaxID=2029408 RepID=UPI001AF02369
PTAGLTENAAKVLHDETAGVDASSNDQAGALPAAFAALGTALGWAASASAVVTPNSSFGTDGGTQTLSLGVSGANVDSGFDSLAGHNILLNVEGGLVVGRVDVGNDGSTTGDPVAIAISISQAGILSIAQYVAIAHPDTTNPNDVKTMLDGALLAIITATDGDGDTSSTNIAIGDKVQIRDDGPTAGLTENAAKVLHDETAGVDASSNDQAGALPAAFAALGTALGWAASASAVVTPNSSFGTDGGTQTLSLGVSGANVDSGFDSLAGHNILLNVEGGLVVGRVDVGNDGSTTGDPVAIAISISQAGILSIAQYVAIAHPDTTNPNDVKTMLDGALLAIITATDGDGDTSSTNIAIGDKVQIRDDGPTITVPFDGDQNTGNGTGTHEALANTLNASATGAFGYDIGTDSHPASFYDATHSDFVDANGALDGIQIGLTGNLTGLVPTPGTTPFLSSFATLQSESDTSASFNWQISYDSDPNTAGNQTATAGGTLVFNKVADTYTITLNDTVEGFTKDILHTSELLSKEPVSNVGHPNIVVEKLFDASTTSDQTDRDFFVQFTGNSNPNGNPFGFNATGDGNPVVGGVNDTIFNAGQQISSNFEDWVSATQATNGVAGDTIQKGELLTLRFFDHSPGIITDDGANSVPNQTANDMAIKFDGIGNSEDLMLILNLVNFGTDGVAGGTGTAADTFTTKAMYVSNADIFKTGQVPTAYAADFPLDNNDGLVIVERNDYNGAGENWVLQGVQIMQSGNGLTGPDSNPNLAGLQETPTAIDLQRATGSGGGSTTFALQNWDPTDNDVLKITDIGFTSTQTTTPDAHLDFAFQVADADLDQTTPQHILVDVA